jgi:hypothetical protein
VQNEQEISDSLQIEDSKRFTADRSIVVFPAPTGVLRSSQISQGEVVRLPSLKDDFPKPTPWDLAALTMLALGGAAMVANLLAAKGTGPGSALSGTQTSLFATLGLAVCVGCLLLLGKTAKEGTIWGNLAAIGGMFIGVSGVLLAAALWVAA